MKLLRIFFYPYYNTCQTVQNINIFQSVCFLPKSHIQPVLGYDTKVAGFMGQLFVWLALLFLVLYSMSSDCSVILSLSLFLCLWFQRMKVAYFTYSQIIRHLSCNESVVSNLTDFSQFNSDTSANQKTRQLATEN